MWVMCAFYAAEATRRRRVPFNCLLAPEAYVPMVKNFMGTWNKTPFDKRSRLLRIGLCLGLSKRP